MTQPENAPSPPRGLTYRDCQRLIFLAAGLIVVYQLLEPLTTLLLLFLLVFILAAVLNPLAARLEKRGVPRVVSAIGVVTLLLASLTLIGLLLVPPILDELSRFVANFGEKQNRLVEYYRNFIARYPELAKQIPDPSQLVQQFSPSLSGLLGQLGKYTINLVAGLASIVLILVLVIFAVAQPGPLVAGFLAATPDEYRERVANALRRILQQLKNWAWGSLWLGVIVGVMTGIGLWLLGLSTGRAFPYILLFSVIAGIGEMIPNIGPILSSIPPALVALTIDPMLALWVLVLFLVVQQLENNLIVPLVMGQSLNLHPISVTATVLIMGVLFGLLGAILAVPTCAIVKVCWEEFYLSPRALDHENIRAQAEAILAEAPAPPRASRIPRRRR